MAARLGHELNLPVFGLDSIVWLPRWQKRSVESRRALENELISQPDWIIDGVSFDVLLAADLAVFLDVSRWISFKRCALRNWSYLFRSRPGLPPNCPEIAIIGRLISIIWQFKERTRPQILAFKQANPGRVVIFTKNETVEELARDVARQHAILMR